MQRNIAGSRCKVSIIVTASITLARFIALITSRLWKSLGFFFQEFVQSLLDTTTDQFFQPPLDNFLVELYNLIGRGL